MCLLPVPDWLWAWQKSSQCSWQPVKWYLTSWASFPAAEQSNKMYVSFKYLSFSPASNRKCGCLLPLRLQEMAIPLSFRGTGQGTSAEASSSFQQQKSTSCPKSKEGKQVRVWFNKKIDLGAEHVGQREEEMTVKASPLCVQRRKQIRFTQRTVPKKKKI